MNSESKTLIIAECNFLEKAFFDLYIGTKEFTEVARREIHNRLQAIRDEVRKDNKE